MSRICFILCCVAGFLAGCEIGRLGDGRVPAAATSTSADATPAGAPPTARPPDLLVATPLLPTPTLAPERATAEAASPTPSLTPSPSFTPTATPELAERLELAQAALHLADYESAINQLTAALAGADALSTAQQARAHWDLGRAHLELGQHEAALTALTAYRAFAVEPDPALAYHLGRAYVGLGDCAAAVAAWGEYLAVRADLAAYVQPRIASCRLEAGDMAGAISAYRAALAGPAHRLTQVDLQFKLAELALALPTPDYAAAVAAYDAIHDLAQTETTRGQVTYLAGQALVAAGDVAGGQARYQTAVFNYPRSYSSYQALIALVEAGVPVDEFQRGLVDYYAGAYQPGIEAFQRYLAANAESYRPDTHLYLAWSYEALGNADAALAQIDAYAATGPDDPVTQATSLIRRAELLARLGRRDDANAVYDQFLERFPSHPEAAGIAFQTAVLSARNGDHAAAGRRYQAMADSYPEAPRAAEALFAAGLSQWRAGAGAAAVAAWEQLINRYPTNDYAAAGLIWLLQHGPSGRAGDYQAQAAGLASVSYYPLRANDLANGRPPFDRPATLNLAPDPSDQAAADAWLRGWLELEETADVATLDTNLAADPRLRLGTELWHLGLLNEAKRELEAVRSELSIDPRRSYQLALYFRDLGLYRSSILAAAAMLNASPDNVFTAPPFVGRLLYPIYYLDAVQQLAGRYGYDPLLQLALIRQESLFESFASSSAAAKGLSQVIPDTGEYIARRLNWPNFQDADLYRPFVGLAFGAYYLNEQLSNFDGSVYAALAAYNGGPGNAARWLEQARSSASSAEVSPDLFLETVTFAETRLYIERIYTGHAIYRQLYGAD